MNLTVDEITKSITGRYSLYECDTEELKQVTNRYPFFGPARFLLAKKLKQEQSPVVDEHIQKASLYFQNPVWFDHLLNETGIIETFIPEKHVTPVSVNEEEENAGGSTVVSEEEEENEAPIIIEEEEKAVEVPVVNEEVEKVDEAPVVSEEDDKDEVPVDQDEAIDEKPLELPKFKFEPVDVSNTELTFEPYHTIDYFASQGIKVVEEVKPEDKLGKQLKSFTEWLKVLKKVPVSEIVSTVSQQDEQKVEKLAEVSINDREVVTEAMAEVWEKQGNTSKAIEVYQKLSLLNPPKSSYFAAKIEQLKNL